MNKEYRYDGSYFGCYPETLGLRKGEWYSASEVPEKFTTSAWRAYSMSVAYDGDGRLIDLSNQQAIIADIKATGARHGITWFYDGGQYLFVKVGGRADAALKECRDSLREYPILDENDYHERAHAYGMEVLKDEFGGYPHHLEFTDQQLEDAARMHGEMTDHYPQDIAQDGWWPANDPAPFLNALALVGVDTRPEDERDETAEYAYIPASQGALPGVEGQSYGWQVTGPVVARINEWGQWETA